MIESATRQETQGTSPEASKGRLVSLDAFRGMTIAGMILVNNPGSWAHVYPPLLHAEWHGWTPTDLIFPFFLFIMGVALPISYDRRLERGLGRGALARHGVRRSAVLFGLGVFMAAYPSFSGWDTLRIMGVLQRIGLVYLLASLLYLWLPRRALPWIGLSLLLGYWALMTLVPVPGYGAGDLSPEGNLGAFLDRLILGQEHLWRDDPWDPEGLLSSLPAVVTALLGIAVGRWLLRSGGRDGETLRGLLLGGILLTVVGWAWGLVFPINKNLWTSSYVVFTGGLATLLLGAWYWLVEMKGYRRWATPFVVYGMNAIAVFVLSGLVTKTLVLVRVGGEEGISAYGWLHANLFASWLSPENASLGFALGYVLLWLAAMWLLHRREIFIKI